MATHQNPIGVFDSGIGGLTVVRALTRELPHENIVYFGDTARVPYGPKSPQVVREYALQDTEFCSGMT
jgi:glutamate racemase